MNKLAYIKGDVGEVITASALRKLGLTIVRTLYVPTEDSLTEIDMVGVSSSGIFIVENKNYKGIVKGKLTDYYWSVNYSSYCKERLYNPILQNDRHKKYLLYQLELLGIENIPIYSPVIFNDSCVLSLRGVDGCVHKLSDFSSYYNKLDSEVLSKDSITRIVNFLRLFSDQSDEAKIHYLKMRSVVSCE